MLYQQLQGSSPTHSARSERCSRTRRIAIGTAKAQCWHGTGRRQSPNVDSMARTTVMPSSMGFIPFCSF